MTVDDLLTTMVAFAVVEFALGFVCGACYRSLFKP